MEDLTHNVQQHYHRPHLFESIEFPVPWADDSRISFLSPVEEIEENRHRWPSQNRLELTDGHLNQDQTEQPSDGPANG